ncbi:hypothetical protein [Mycobacterium asiaticum]|uniref:Mammalian cell entry protein n=1 Tax=Mycobacterium asiaticum TaxID=1790 RepID=A0A1A3N9A2_MYCAS|nr:hypothetical protein A5636_02365 [Mycobacterium asiaticum]
MRDPDGPDTDHGEDPEGAMDPDEPQSSSVSDSGAEDISEADAQDEVAKAEAQAEAARARLARLRRVAEVDAPEDDAKGDAEDGPAEDGEAEDDRAASRDAAAKVERRRPKWRARPLGLRRSRRTRRSRRPGRKAVAIGVGVALAATSLGAIGYMQQQHHTIAHKRRLSQDYAAAARQAVTTLMSIDANHAKDDIQRIIDASTGPLKNQISVMSSLMLEQAQESKTITKVNVEAVAVESVTDSSAVALIVAKSEVTEADNKKRPPQLWRLSMEIVRDGSQFKMSKVDFLQ